ncbi:MAG: hypothetical protein LBG11_00910 [Bifidobacteriaceae bacterium]|jgi:hypothetical protein|nr:hypothetical protein [Bifidobacteriaceae bacterium]
MTNGEKRIAGSIAEVVSDREVILNRGSAHGVKNGMYFAILNPDAKRVKDPKTGEVLGDLRLVKTVVRAVEVAPRLTLARTFRTREVNVGGRGPDLLSFADMMSAPRYVEKVETFKIDEDTPRKIAPAESIVAVGDPFEEAAPEEAEDDRSISLSNGPLSSPASEQRGDSAIS